MRLLLVEDLYYGDVEPIVGFPVAPRLQTVSDAKTPDRPGVDRVDGSELRKVEWLKLGRTGLETGSCFGTRVVRLEPVELQDLVHIGATRIHVGEVAVGLENMAESVEGQPAGLHPLETLRDLERILQSGIENGPEHIARSDKRVSLGNTVGRGGIGSVVCVGERVNDTICVLK